MIDITNYANQQISLRFLLRTDGSQNLDGWYVDNVKISVYNSVVPVELVSFIGNVINNEVQLNWTTATELNNLGFEIERSLTPSLSKGEGEWVKIGFVNGFGTSSEVHTYLFADKNPITGKSYYRLKQLDFDGTFEYSNVIEIEFGMITAFTLEQNYPNPFNPSTKINWQSPFSSWQSLKVYDVLGNEVATLVDEYKPAGSYEVEFDATGLSSGMYFYKLEAGKFSSIKKMILLR